MSCDRHEVAAGGHDVTEEGQVAVVDVGAIKGDDMVQLFLHCLADSFNSQYLCGWKLTVEYMYIYIVHVCIQFMWCSHMGGGWV